MSLFCAQSVPSRPAIIKPFMKILSAASAEVGRKNTCELLRLGVTFSLHETAVIYISRDLSPLTNKS